MFLIKKPKWLEFVYEEFDPRISKAARRQIRTMGSLSNAKIVTFEDNSVFLKVGNEMYPLRYITLPTNYVMMEKCENGYKKLCKIEKKCFISEVSK